MILLLCALHGLCLRAQEFTTLDWSVLRIDSVLPVYTEVVPLETDCRMFDYTVRIEYPQYAELTKEEAAVARRYAGSLADSVVVDTHVGMQRGEGMLDISFVPVVCRNERFYKLLSARISIIPSARPNARMMARAAAARYAENSVLSAGKWVKIALTSDGIYQLTRQALRRMGFSKPENVRLYGYGGHRIDETLSSGSSALLQCRK